MTWYWWVVIGFGVGAVLVLWSLFKMADYGDRCMEEMDLGEGNSDDERQAGDSG